jgi:hypothetical protein
MAIYYIKATGTNTWPFNSETTAAPTLFDLFTALGDHSITLGSSDTIQVSGLITETVDFQEWSLNGALIQGTNSEIDQINMASTELDSGIIRRLGIWSQSPSANVYLFNFYEISYCRIGYTAPDNFDAFVIMVYYTGLVNSTHVYNNIFYKTGDPNNYVNLIPGMLLVI